MKKIMYLCMVIIIVAVTALLYTHTSTFNQNNIDRIYIEGTNPFELNVSDQMVEVLIKKLESLKQYKTSTTHQTVLKKTLVVEKVFGSDDQYDIMLDYDFDQVLMKDNAADITYVIDDELVEWVYMHEAFEEIYKYKEIKRHHILLNDESVTTLSEIKWTYIKGNHQWYTKNEYKNNLNRINIIDGVFDLEMVYDEMPAQSILKVYENDQLIHESPAYDGGFVPDESGLYLYEIETTWQNDLKTGTQVSRFEVYCDYLPKFEVSKTQIEQGKFIVITGHEINQPESLYVESDYLEGMKFEKRGDLYECIIPATYYTTPGVYTLNYGVKGHDYSLTFEVLPRAFERQYLTVDEKTTQATQNAEAYAEYNKFYKPALLENVYEPTKAFLEVPQFILPTTGRVTTEFGVQRYVNNKLTSYHHGGLDIAIDRGTPIVATFEGQVVLAQYLMVTGNSVVINHGHGIFSTYFHMDTIEVEKGDVLNTGDALGTVGTTGFSTGPHLHFSISYYKMNLEPGYFIYGEKVTYSNYKSLFNQD